MQISLVWGNKEYQALGQPSLFIRRYDILLRVYVLLLAYELNDHMLIQYHSMFGHIQNVINPNSIYNQIEIQ